MVGSKVALTYTVPHGASICGGVAFRMPEARGG
jgi:hypothetical protein